MEDDIAKILTDAESGMDKSLEYLESELVKIRAGKVSPNILNGVWVDYYGTPTPIDQVANINVVDSRTLSIKPWEKKKLQDIEKAIFNANIGITPQNDGEQIRIFMPPVTEDRRKELVKQSLSEGEQAKVSIRSVRKEAMDKVKNRAKDSLSEDEAKGAEAKIQELTDEFTGKVDQFCAAKEKQVMTV